MSDPIAHLVALQGEDAVLMSPATVKPYKPGLSADYAPNAPVSLNVRGVPETKIELETGEEGAFTFQTNTKPAGLMKDASQLRWRNQDWTVKRIRERTWFGRINGYTLFLGI